MSDTKIHPFDSQAGKDITEAMSLNPYNGRTDDDERAARCTAWDMYLLNERDSLIEGSLDTPPLDSLLSGAQEWADTEWNEYL